MFLATIVHYRSAAVVEILFKIRQRDGANRPSTYTEEEITNFTRIACSPHRSHQRSALFTYTHVAVVVGVPSAAVKGLAVGRASRRIAARPARCDAAAAAGRSLGGSTTDRAGRDDSRPPSTLILMPSRSRQGFGLSAQSVDVLQRSRRRRRRILCRVASGGFCPSAYPSDAVACPIRPSHV